MYLNSKYLLGFGILVGTNVIFSFSNVFTSPAIYLIIFGISTTIIGVVFVYLLFSPERIKGYRAEYEISPDLTSFKVAKQLVEKIPVITEIPEVAFCSTCGKKIFKPFSCSICGQILCGEHYLPGDHSCREVR
ncbi:MAG: AN1-type zinc finger domain-containing protein [Candidatus Hodarchaeales archaeon]|jgi:hypothetical protein